MLKSKAMNSQALVRFQLDYKFPHVKIGAGGSLVLQGFQDVLNLKK
jgi:hypothetical protein